MATPSCDTVQEKGQGGCGCREELLVDSVLMSPAKLRAPSFLCRAASRKRDACFHAPRKAGRAAPMTSRVIAPGVERGGGDGSTGGGRRESESQGAGTVEGCDKSSRAVVFAIQIWWCGDGGERYEGGVERKW